MRIFKDQEEWEMNVLKIGFLSWEWNISDHKSIFFNPGWACRTKISALTFNLYLMTVYTGIQEKSFNQMKNDNHIIFKIDEHFICKQKISR